MTDAPTKDAPGRLGTPDMVLKDDPRIDPRIKATLAAFEMDGETPPPPVGPHDPKDALLGFCEAIEPGFEGLFQALDTGLDRPAGVTHETVTIQSDEGHDITIYVHRPAYATEAVPGVLHIHGGGMAILSTAGAAYNRWRDLIAATGMAVFGVEFRNSAGALGPHPFPAGLNDCSAALHWLNANRADLGLSKIIVTGESGGGNLTLATAMKAASDGHTSAIDGLFAMCPYISNAYRDMPDTYPSLRENDGYFVRNDMLDIMAALYDGPNSANPLAWPGHASAADLKDLPSTMISVNECDPLRDEGLTFANSLRAAGVQTQTRVVPGTTHAADCIFQGAMPDTVAATVQSIRDFADTV